MQKQNSFSDRFPLVEARHVLSSSQRIHVYTDLNSVWSSLELQGLNSPPFVLICFTNDSYSQ